MDDENYVGVCRDFVMSLMDVGMKYNFIIFYISGTIFYWSMNWYLNDFKFDFSLIVWFELKICLISFRFGS